MARWQVTIEGKGVRKSSVEKLAEKMKDQFGEAASISVKDDTPPESRADRFAAAMSLVSDAMSEVESLKDELEEWHGNMPENFQNGDKGNQIQEAIDNLENIYSELDSISSTDVDFPGMY